MARRKVRLGFRVIYSNSVSWSVTMAQHKVNRQWQWEMTITVWSHKGVCSWTCKRLSFITELRKGKRTPKTNNPSFHGSKHPPPKVYSHVHSTDWNVCHRFYVYDCFYRDGYGREARCCWRASHLCFVSIIKETRSKLMEKIQVQITPKETENNESFTAAPCLCSRAHHQGLSPSFTSFLHIAWSKRFWSRLTKRKYWLKCHKYQ